ncbi:hypothetical protein GCM10009626_16710 [Brachybacterium sacelli]
MEERYPRTLKPEVWSPARDTWSSTLKHAPVPAPALVLVLDTRAQAVKLRAAPLRCAVVCCVVIAREGVGAPHAAPGTPSGGAGDPPECGGGVARNAPRTMTCAAPDAATCPLWISAHGGGKTTIARCGEMNGDNHPLGRKNRTTEIDIPNIVGHTNPFPNDTLDPTPDRDLRPGS